MNNIGKRGSTDQEALIVTGISETTLSARLAISWLRSIGWRVRSISLSKLQKLSMVPSEPDKNVGGFDRLSCALVKLKPSNQGPWDLVVGNSLGGSLAISAQSKSAGTWATGLLALDPPISITLMQAERLNQSLFARGVQPYLRTLNQDWPVFDRVLKLLGHIVTRRRHSKLLAQLAPVDLLDTVTTLNHRSAVIASDLNKFSFVSVSDRERIDASQVRLRNVERSGHDLLQESAETVISEISLLISHISDDKFQR